MVWEVDLRAKRGVVQMVYQQPRRQLVMGGVQRLPTGEYHLLLCPARATANEKDHSFCELQRVGPDGRLHSTLNFVTNESAAEFCSWCASGCLGRCGMWCASECLGRCGTGPKQTDPDDENSPVQFPPKDQYRGPPTPVPREVLEHSCRTPQEEEGSPPSPSTPK